MRSADVIACQNMGLDGWCVLLCTQRREPLDTSAAKRPMEELHYLGSKKKDPEISLCVIDRHIRGEAGGNGGVVGHGGMPVAKQPPPLRLTFLFPFAHIDVFLRGGWDTQESPSSPRSAPLV